MHKALRRALSLTAVPAVAVATAAMLALPASAAAARSAAVTPGTSGPDMYSPMEAGYAATQNAFRFVKADFILPDPTTFKNYLSRVEYTVELWSSSRDTILGVYASTSDTSAKPWHIEAKVYNNKTHALLCATWSAKKPCNGTITGSWSDTFASGDKMELSSMFSKSNGTDRFHANDLTTGTNVYDYHNVGTSIFGQARIGAEFGCTPWAACGGELVYSSPPSALQVIRADDAELSINGTLVAFDGPFVHSKVIMTANGASTGKVLAYPEHLSQDLEGFHSDSPDGEFDVALPAHPAPYTGGTAAPGQPHYFGSVWAPRPL